jgi:hypothetical protein
VWQPAAVVVDRLLACVLEHPGPIGAIRPGRFLDDEHFEFRGESLREEACCSRVAEW